MHYLTAAFVAIKALIIACIGLSTAALDGWCFGPEVELCLGLLALAVFKVSRPARRGWVQAAITALELALAAGLYLSGAGSLANGIFTIVVWDSAFTGGSFVRMAAASTVAWVALATLRVSVYGAQFEPFVATKRHGTGLGLAISRNIVLAHGGRFEAHSRPGAGTIFRLWLPLKAPSVTAT